MQGKDFSFMLSIVSSILIIIVGFTLVFLGLASFIFSPRDIGTKVIVLGGGIFSSVFGCFWFSRIDRFSINSLLLKVTCVYCRHYVGQNVVNVSVQGRMRVNYMVPNFSKGICFEKDFFIKDGYNSRRCAYFQQRKKQ